MQKLVFAFVAVFFFFTRAFSIGETPQQIIGSLEGSLKGVRKSVIDSVKSHLSSRYVEDYRTYGSTAAYDSLCRRVRVLKAANEHNEGDTLASTRFVEQPLSEVDRLKQENSSLKNEISMLKYGPAEEAELTQLQKRTRWIVKQLVIKNNEMADTLWKVYIDTSFGRSPLFFDSISARSLLPFMPKYVRPKYLLAKPAKARYVTPFEELYRRNDIRNLVNEKVTYSLVGRDPGAFDFVGLGSFTDDLTLVDDKTNNVQRLEEGNATAFGQSLTKPKASKGKVNPWKSEGKFSVQFSQYYVTPDWYKGGEPNALLLGDLEYGRKYNKDGVMWDNEFKIKLGFYATPKDTNRTFRVNNDEFRIKSFAGKSYFSPKLYFGGLGDFQTQFFRNYKGTNSNEIKASFFSPTVLKLSLGARYEHNSAINAYVSPLAYKLIFLVNDDIEDPKTVGIREGKAQDDFGFLVNGNLKWKFNKDISVTSGLDVFVPYSMENVIMDWQTAGYFNINRFLSTKLTLNLRFDSTPVDKNYENPKLQIQELFSFGFLCRI